ncbi:esterase-like activity of phytase family protein [Colwelliaceae bacterium BS250]
MLKKSAKCLQVIAGVLIIVSMKSNAFALEIDDKPFTSAKVDIPGAHSSVQLIHRNRAYSGGLSSLWVSRDCSQLITISDYSQTPDSMLDGPVNRSAWFQADIEFDQQGALQRVNLIEQGQVKNIDGAVIDGAIESMAWGDDGFYLSFDHHSNIYYYPGTKPAGVLFNQTPTIAIEQSHLGTADDGLEALSYLGNNQFLAIWEKQHKSDRAIAAVISSEQKRKRFDFLTPTDASGATTLNDGSVIILQKQYLGPKIGNRVRVNHISATTLANIADNSQETPVNSTLLFDKTSLYYDNFEGISACYRDNQQWLFMLSDDNGDWPENMVEKKGKKRQRTLLLMVNLNELFTSN